MPDSSWDETILGAVDAGDAAGFCDYLTEDATFRWGARDPVIGRRPIQDYVETFLGMFDGTRHEVLEALEADGVRVVRGEVTYLMKDGRVIALPFCNVLHLEGDRIREYLVHVDPTPLA
jgi:ketosteroid isomerase-like protein